MDKLFAVTTRGLEEISAGEMAQLPGLQVTGRAYRRVSAVYTGDLSVLLGLRTVDDIFIDLAAWENIPPQRAALEQLTHNARRLRLAPALEAIRRLRPVAPAPAFSVTANFVGRRNYNAEEIKEAVAAGIRASTDWAYVPDDESEINLRLFLEHDQAYLGLRLAAAPLHRRPYKQANLPGSLKPTVAAAMLIHAGLLPGDSLLDPFCGAGTILIEAALLGAEASGGDQDYLAVEAARENAVRAGVSIPIEPWDARQLPLPGRSVPLVVTNLPWGRQVEAGEDPASFYEQACTEIERVLTSNGKVVCLTNLPHLLVFKRLRPASQTAISLFGQTPSILKYSPF